MTIVLEAVMLVVFLLGVALGLTILALLLKDMRK